MSNDIWNARREQLEEAAIKVVLDLFEHTGSAAILLDLDPPHGKLFLSAGSPSSIQQLVSMVESRSPAPARAEEGDTKCTK